MSKQSGKGDKPRNCFSKEFLSNFDSISWDKKDMKFESAGEENVELYSKHVHELICCLLDEPDPEYFVTDESMVADFMPEKEDFARLKKLQAKYNLKRITKSDLIWMIAKSMKESKGI